MRVLITNHSLSARTGTEAVVYEIARDLQRRGHEVAAYSSSLGEVAELLSASSIAVISDPSACPFRPDIIHAQHHLDAMTALLAFPDTPAVYHLHGGVPWVERPPRHPRIVHYLATCEQVAGRTRLELGLSSNQVSALPNWVDLDRFRGGKIPSSTPTRALLFGGGLGSPEIVDRVMPAFATHHIKLETTADWTDQERRTPELALPGYDIVLASGRSALEAMASGCAVVIVNHQSCIGWARQDNFLAFQQQNFSPNRADPGYDASVMQGCLAAYDAQASLDASAMTRKHCALPQAMDQLAAVHERVVQAWSQRPVLDTQALLEEQDEERKASLVYLRQLATAVRDVEALHVSSRSAQKQLASAAKEREKLTADLRRLEGKLARAAEVHQTIKHLRQHWLGRLALSWSSQAQPERNGQPTPAASTADTPRKV
jgi:hypothetical protein